MKAVSVLALLLTLGAASAKYCPGSGMLCHYEGDYTCHKTCIHCDCDQEAWVDHQRRALVSRECNFILSSKQDC
ncbi:hypothetical protein COCVIDRAFT_88977 [Bipolaris victoriae FI3]|uniref:Uncharacterized protein n=1 Tax=Bipolaris victoriae (strain FI3) TaxID=930091 RepID=W7EV46_BIPV3|nr:hypothetical protein COCVIDRAFT_88977 [Bipolaris victoriae FI3]